MGIRRCFSFLGSDERKGEREKRERAAVSAASVSHASRVDGSSSFVGRPLVHGGERSGRRRGREEGAREVASLLSVIEQIPGIPAIVETQLAFEERQRGRPRDDK